MAHLPRLAHRVPEYIPNEEELAARVAEVRAKRLAAIAAGEPLPDGNHRKARQPKAKPVSTKPKDKPKRFRPAREARKHEWELNLANRHLNQVADAEQEEYRDARQVEEWLPVPKADEPREMEREDIANVEFINSSDLDSVFDSLIESVSFQHALEDCECRWNVADVDPDLMDLGDPIPTLAIHDHLALDADERGTPQEMSKADRCNVDMSSLLRLNAGVEGVLDLERWGVGDVDPDAEDVSDAATYERMEANAKPIPMALKTETHRDVVAFRSKRR